MTEVRPGIGRCPTCEIEKPVEDFAVDRRKANGRATRCRPCDSAKSRAYYDSKTRTSRRDRPCAGCGTTVPATARPDQLYCSRACRQVWTPRHRRAFECAHCRRHCIPGADGVGGHAARFCSRRCLDRCLKPRVNLGPSSRWPAPPPRRFVEGPCPECGERVLHRDHPSAVGYCSKRCKLRQKRRKHRAAKAGVGAKTLTFRTIAERDEWTCHLCGDAVDRTLKVPDPMAPTLDHVVPLRHGGSHDESNVQLAHSICNSRKSDGTAVAIGAQTTLV